MTDLRNLCRCGHARSSHRDGAGPCDRNYACPCVSWAPAFSVFDVELPVGVVALRPAHAGLTVVECRHAPELRSPGGWCGWCFGAPDTTAGFELAVKRLVFAPTELRLL